MGLLRRHEKTPHVEDTAREEESETPKEQESSAIKCSKCDFSSKSKAHLTNHIQSNHVQRTKNSTCRFWQNGYCRYTEEDCRFSHTIYMENKKKMCYYGLNCRNPNCTFYHPKPCDFQENCRNVNCTFFHFGYEPFLDMISMTEFPPLNTRNFNPRMSWY